MTSKLTPQSQRFLHLVLLGCAALSAQACSESKKDGVEAVDAVGSGSIAEVWQDTCIATFNEDYEAADVFGDPVLSAKKGSKYVIGSIGFGGGVEPELIQVTPDGPISFRVESKDDTWEGLPFSTDCDPETAREYRGVFADVTVYADRELKEVLCELKSGDRAVADDNGFGYESIDFSDGRARFEITLGALSTLCDDETTGYIEINDVDVNGTQTSLVPFESFLAPR